MKQVMNCHKDNGLLNMTRRTDPMINNLLWKYANFLGEKRSMTCPLDLEKHHIEK